MIVGLLVALQDYHIGKVAFQCDMNIMLLFVLYLKQYSYYFARIIIGYKELGLMMLETRRIRADLIEVFKILRGMAGAVEGIGLVRDEEGRRGHDHKLYINSVRLDVGKFMFSN